VIAPVVPLGGGGRAVCSTGRASLVQEAAGIAKSTLPRLLEVVAVAFLHRSNSSARRAEGGSAAVVGKAAGITVLA